MTNSKYFQFISQLYKNLPETDEKNPTNNLILTLAKRNRVHRGKKKIVLKYVERNLRSLVIQKRTYLSPTGLAEIQSLKTILLAIWKIGTYIHSCWKCKLVQIHREQLGNYYLKDMHTSFDPAMSLIYRYASVQVMLIIPYSNDYLCKRREVSRYPFTGGWINGFIQYQPYDRILCTWGKKVLRKFCVLIQKGLQDLLLGEKDVQQCI